jgi:predicted nucleotidyltransferase
MKAKHVEKKIQLFKARKTRKNKKIMIKDLILPKSMLCVVKKYSMNGCEMSSLFLGHFYFIKWYLKEKDQEKTKPN